MADSVSARTEAVQDGLTGCVGCGTRIDHHPQCVSGNGLAEDALYSLANDLRNLREAATTLVTTFQRHNTNTNLRAVDRQVLRGLMAVLDRMTEEEKGLKV